MRYGPGLALPLLLVVARATGDLSATAPAQRTDEAWAERLFYPLLKPGEVDFHVTLDDLRGVTQRRPDKRVAHLRERIEAGDDEVDTRLDLVRALVAANERGEAQPILEELAQGLLRELKRDPEDWERVAQLGEVSLVAGMHFGDRKALEACLRLLGTACAGDAELWRARTSLAELFLWQATLLHRSDEGGKADRALQRAREASEEALEIAEDEFLPHALLFLVELLQLAVDDVLEPLAAIEPMLELAEALSDASELSEAPGVTDGIAAVYEIVSIANVCREHWNTVEAFEQLAEDLDAVGQLARDIPDLVERAQGLEVHRRLGPTGALACWWIARHGELESAEELFERALEMARDPALVLESAIGIESRCGAWDTAEEYVQRLLEERDDGRSMYVAGHVAALGGEHGEAIGRFEQAMDDGLTEAAVGIAVCILKQDGDRERAIELLEEALEQDDELAAAHFALGTALALEGAIARAREHLEAALELSEEATIGDFAEAIEATLEELPELDD